MNNIEDNPNGQEGHSGESSPSEIINQMVDKLGELLHDHPNSSGITINYYNSVGQRIDRIETQYMQPLHDPPRRRGDSLSGELPEELHTTEAMALWKRVQQAGYVDDNFQPKVSRTQAALLAHYMAKKLEIKDKWKIFESLWNRRNMYRDYYDAMNQDQTYSFLDKLKELHD